MVDLPVGAGPLGPCTPGPSSSPFALAARVSALTCSRLGELACAIAPWAARDPATAAAARNTNFELMTLPVASAIDVAIPDHPLIPRRGQPGAPRSRRAERW